MSSALRAVGLARSGPRAVTKRGSVTAQPSGIPKRRRELLVGSSKRDGYPRIRFSHLRCCKTVSASRSDPLHQLAEGLKAAESLARFVAFHDLGLHLEEESAEVGGEGVAGEARKDGLAEVAKCA